MRLGQPQHVLIHLCEKGVVVPDLSPGKGRGKVRLFSLRNLYEFSVALELRKYDLPMQIVKLTTKSLRSFEKSIQKQFGKFKLPQSLIQYDIPFLLDIYDGKRVVFHFTATHGVTADLAAEGQRKRIIYASQQGIPPERYKTRISVNLIEIARDLL